MSSSYGVISVKNSELLDGDFEKKIIGRWSRARHYLKARENYNILLD